LSNRITNTQFLSARLRLTYLIPEQDAWFRRGRVGTGPPAHQVIARQ